MNNKYLSEVWKPVKNYEGLYLISNFGRVRSVNRWVECNGGHRFIPSKIRKKRIGSLGYECITLCIKSNCTNNNIHRMIAEAFIPNPENKPCVNHIDGNKLNNSLDNLEWCTYSENTKHAFKTGLKKPSLRNHKKTVYEYDLKLNLIAVFDSCAEASKKYNIKGRGIAKNARGESKSYKGRIWKYEAIKELNNLINKDEEV